MKISFSKICLLVLLIGNIAWASDGNWLTDFEEAKTKARKEGKKILADFSGSDWCYWCKILDKEVFSTATFKKYAQQHFVLLMLDFPRENRQSNKIKKQNKALAKKFGISVWFSNTTFVAGDVFLPTVNHFSIA